MQIVERFYSSLKTRGLATSESTKQICLRNLPYLKRMDYCSKFVILWPTRNDGATKIRLVRIREFHSHACMPEWHKKERENMAFCQSDVEIVNSAHLFFGYLILLPSFTSNRRRLSHCGSNCGCEKVSRKFSGLICLQIMKACNTMYR